MPVQGTQFSPSANMVNKAQDFFAICQTDGKVKYTAKVTGRILPNAALAVASLVETVVLAILTAVTFLPSYLSNRPYDACKAGTALAGRATAEALRGIVGNSTENPNDVSKAITRKERVMAFVDRIWNSKVRSLSAKDVYSFASSYVCNNPRKVVGVVSGLILLGVVAKIFSGAKATDTSTETLLRGKVMQEVDSLNKQIDSLIQTSKMFLQLLKNQRRDLDSQMKATERPLTIH